MAMLTSTPPTLGREHVTISALSRPCNSHPRPRDACTGATWPDALGAPSASGAHCPEGLGARGANGATLPEGLRGRGASDARRPEPLLMLNAYSVRCSCVPLLRSTRQSLWGKGTNHESRKAGKRESRLAMGREGIRTGSGEGVSWLGSTWGGEGVTKTARGGNSRVNERWLGSSCACSAREGGWNTTERGVGEGEEGEDARAMTGASTVVGTKSNAGARGGAAEANRLGHPQAGKSQNVTRIVEDRRHYMNNTEDPVHSRGDDNQHHDHPHSHDDGNVIADLRLDDHTLASSSAAHSDHQHSHHHHDGSECEHHHHHDGSECEHHHHHDGSESEHHHHHDDGDHHGDHHHHDHHHHHHHHHHHLSYDDLNLVQKAIFRAARVTRVALIADALRENLAMSGVSFVMLILASAAPRVVPPSSPIGGTKICSALIALAFPLTGIPALLDGLIDIAGGRINIHVLMTLAAFASVFMGNALEGALLLAMFAISHSAEDYFTRKALGDVNALKDRSPDVALVLEPFDMQEPAPLSNMRYRPVPVREVHVGDFLLVKAGEAIPVDGVVWAGKSSINVEHLTGEALPVSKGPGDNVPGGAMNAEGMLIVRVVKEWGDSTVERIVRLTSEAQRNRPRLQRWLDMFGETYSRAVMAAALSVAVLGPILFKWPIMTTAAGTRGSVYRALGLMVAASPCALAVAPLAYITAISACANKGILLKGGQCFDALAGCDTVAFDKTGTLTTGELMCKIIEPLEGHVGSPHPDPDVSLATATANDGSSTPRAKEGALGVQTGQGEAVAEEGEEGEEGADLAVRSSCCDPDCFSEALAIAAAIERGATHPIARAIVQHSEGRALPAVEVEDFEFLPGEGVSAHIRTFREVSAEVPKIDGSVHRRENLPPPPLQQPSAAQHITAGSGGREEKPAASAVTARLGSLDFVAKSPQFSPEEAERIRSAASALARGSGQLVVAALAVGKKVTLFHFEDKVRPHAARIVSALQGSAGLHVRMLTGDSPANARRLARAVGIKDVLASLKPEDKLWHVTRWSSASSPYPDALPSSLSSLVSTWLPWWVLGPTSLADQSGPEEQEHMQTTISKGADNEGQEVGKGRGGGELSGKSSSRNRGVIMVGDGINDAPALAAATVGVVLAERASATAIAAADVLLLRDGIDSLPFLIAKARQTTLIVRQSVALALVCILAAALPAVLGVLPLWLTVLLHEGGTLVVCLNSVRAFSEPSWPSPARLKMAKAIRSFFLRLATLLRPLFPSLPSSSSWASTSSPIL
ncbi:hypothetical protein CBR_g41425 [Chara braunii]|uniref:P-type ATPase A domain-containing protein n=1 Tax=Chara braunii TaxID=69332 RepID=A0A388LVT3_CHABU|nr:hypothetical protein CBR_g41425 [Chara braunii]|eukprot:GBG86428.1 hypothetical protein CBR_g41425 [Chara braunii]